MNSTAEKKPHAICIPVPLQGHITPMLKLAKILHSKGFLITFVNTEFNHQRLLRSHGLDALHGLPTFRFETIPDGLPPPENQNATQDIPSLAKSIEETALGPFRSVVTKVSASFAPVTCIVADLLMGFSLAVANELGILEILLWTSGTGSMICYNQYPNLLENGLMPLKEKKPHAICIPVPLQGHITPMLKLAKILHSKGFLITFVNTEFNHQRLLRSHGPDALHGLPTFRFETIPDGLPPPENQNATQDIPSLAKSIEETALGPFRSVVTKVSGSFAPVTCIVADLLMGFSLAVANELGIPEILLWTSGTGSLICYNQYPNLLGNGLMPLKDPSDLVNGYLDTVIDHIPTMPGVRLKDMPPFFRIVYPGDEYMVQFICLQIDRAKKASAIIFNTFDELEPEVLNSLASIYPPCYGIGPLHLLEENITDKSLASVKSNLWKEEPECLEWLDFQAPSSVIYVNFGSITVMTPQQLVEFCWGLAKSNYSFLWIIRPDLVIGESAMLPPEFVTETSGRGMLVGWCPQEEVLKHSSIGGFLTHSGWNSTFESISNGVPMICWPFFADQQTNCWWSCNKWGVAMEIDNNVKSNEVAKLVAELMKGEKGKEIRKNVTNLKNKCQEACVSPLGSSILNLEKVIQLMHTSSK